MTENVDILNTAVSLLVRAALLAARFSGQASHLLHPQSHEGNSLVPGRSGTLPSE
jgi:hypothetical protein